MPRLPPCPFTRTTEPIQGLDALMGMSVRIKKRVHFPFGKRANSFFLKSFLFHLAIKKEIGFFLRPRFKIEWETIVRTNRYEAERVLLPRHNLKTQKYPFHP